jgi:hypothetical protein
MRNDTILVLGGLALIIFFATSGSGTVKEIEERVLSLDEMFDTWAEKNKDNLMTRMMGEFLHTSAKVRAIGYEKVQTLTKAGLLEMITSISDAPVGILINLSRSCKVSFAKDKKMVEDFVDNAQKTMWLLVKLFEDVYQLLPGESKLSAEIVTEEIHNQLQTVFTFSI